ncbi:MAG: hypothetical protein ACHREM_08715 [Polyangiales bacterium]
MSATYTVGQRLQILWKDRWYVGRVLREAGRDQWEVSYDGFEANWNEVVGPDRLRTIEAGTSLAADTGAASRGAVAIVGAIVSFVGPQILPVVFRPGAWFACPSATAQTIIVTWTGGTSRGGTSYHWDAYCLQSDGFAMHPSMLVTWAVTTVALLLVVALILLMMTVSGRRSR